MNRNITIFASIVLSFALFFAYTIAGSTAVAQNQSSTNSSSSSNKTSTPQNQTSATVTGKAQIATINKTNIPAQQTTVKINKITKPVEGQAALKPLGNQTIQSQVPSLSGIQNKSIIQATGPATTTIVNKTSVPYNQTIIGTENQSKSVQQQNQKSGQNQSNSTSGGQQTGTANPVGGQGQQQQQQNQSKNPLQQLGSSVGNLLTGKK